MFKNIFTLLCFSLANSIKKTMPKPDNLSNSLKSIKKITFKTNNQEIFNEYLNDDKYKIVFCSGPAGCGKSLLSCNYAINSLSKYKEIILTKPLVSVDNEQLGFLPGDLNSKMAVWGEHFIELFNSIYSKSEIKKLVNNETIKVKPMAYLRGKTFTNSLIISDEMQNSSPTQLKMLLTRLGDDSKLILLGDPHQKDIHFTSGIDDFLKKYKQYLNGLSNDEKNNSLIKMIEMDDMDVSRSPVVKEVLNIYNIKTHQSTSPFIYVRNDTKYIEKNETTLTKPDCSVFSERDEYIYGRWKNLG